MLSFLQAGHVDEALQAFNDMRSTSQPQLKADQNVYIHALRGFGALGDLQAVRNVHNQLKLDINVDPSVPLWTELINAYTNCDQPRYALKFWQEIQDLAGGPDEQSVLAALQACQLSPVGATDIENVWGSVVKENLPVSASMFSSLVGALTANGKEDDARMEIKSNGTKYDLVSALANYLHASYDPDEALQWIGEHYQNHLESIKNFIPPKHDVERHERAYKKFFSDAVWE